MAKKIQCVSALNHQNTQSGSVLLWGLVVLIVLTLLGLAAAKMAGTDTRIAGNQMLYMQAWENAESNLSQFSKVGSGSSRGANILYQTKQTEQTGNRIKDKIWERELDLASVSGSGVDANGKQEWKGQNATENSISCAPIEGIAMTTEMTPSLGGVARGILTTDIEATVSGTGASSNHAEGWCIPMRN